MSRTTFCVLTAALLAAASAAAMAGRCYVLGDAARVPTGPGTWKVTLLVHGHSAGGDVRLLTALPPDFGHQHISHEVCHSDELWARPPEARHPQRHQVLWSQRPGVREGPFRARCRFYCSVDVRAPSAPMSTLTRAVYAPPREREQLAEEARIESDHPEVSALARRLTEGIEEPGDQLDALFHYVDQEIANEPTVQGLGRTALECLRSQSGDSGAKARLLVALCRNRGVPARLVKGLALKRGREQKAHAWAEVWIRDHWVSACPVYHHLGRVPSTFLILSYGDLPLVHGRNVRDLDYAFLVERPTADEEADAAGASPLARVLTRLSLYALPPAEQRLVEFLLLLPIAALIVCVYRNVVGVLSFGTFAPALVGLAFRDLGGLPGILVFVAIVLLGWLMRRVLDSYHLLQVPRMAFLLSLVVVVLIVAIVGANHQDLPATKYISVFPMVILTGMIERFWTLEAEDGTAASFRTLVGTLFIAATISLVLSLRAVVRHMFCFPETLGLIMAVQLLIGRYTGYRLSELFRFRDFLVTPETDG
jgi:hypothetical protein